MSIIEQTQQHKSVTKGWRALRFFTNREQAIRHFMSYLHHDSPFERILFFHGDGGNGKSLLLRYLRENCCKLLQRETWAYLQGLRNDRLFVAHLKKFEGIAIPYASLDFGMPPHGDERPQEAFYALLMLRRSLSGYGLDFPLYDFATVWYLHQTKQLNDERLRHLFPMEELDFVAALVDVIYKNSFGALANAILSVFDKQLKERFTLYMKQRQIDSTLVKQIQHMDPHSELMDELPRLFAQDLNVAMTLDQAPSHLVLFFDTHEAFWGQHRETAHGLYFQRDEWLRYLLSSLEYKNGIVTIVAGRELPRWSVAAHMTIPNQYVDGWLVGHFTEQNARHYLTQARVSDFALQQALLDFTEIAPNQYHPLYLGLGVDAVQAALRHGIVPTVDEFAQTQQIANKQQELVDRLLRYVDSHISYAICALSVSRSFNRQIYFTLGQALHFQVSQPAFDILTQFSFVWQDEQRGKGWYRIHQLLRRLLPERNQTVAQQAHEVLERYHRKQAEEGDKMAIAEAIYHANQLEWELGIEEWVDVFDDAIKMSDYHLCRTLLEVHPDLSIEDDFRQGQVCRAEADYFAKLSRDKNAQQKYEEAIHAFDNALQKTPDNEVIHKDKGRALESLGLLHHNFSQYELAFNCYKQAIVTYNQAIKLKPDYVVAYNNKGIALYELGNLHQSLKQYDQAYESYQQSLVAYDQVFSLNPDYSRAYNNRGLMLDSLGKLQAKSLQNQDALHSYQKAIAAYDQAIDRVPDYAYAYNNKGIVLRHLAILQATLGQEQEAFTCYNQALQAFDKALDLAPDYIHAYNDKGVTFKSLGYFQAKIMDYSSAITSYKESITLLEEALQRAPNYPMIYDNKGDVLRSLANSHVTLTQYPEAIDSYTQAIIAYDEVLNRAPNHVSARNNKGYTLQSLAKLQLSLGQEEEAYQSLEQALSAFIRSLQIVKDDEQIRQAKDAVQQIMEQLNP